MADIENAETFIRQHGTEVERARLEYLIASQPPSSDIIQRLFAGQRPDGGWPPFWAPDYSSLDATCYRIAQADQLGLRGAEPMRRAGRFLLGRQATDGSWEEDQTLRDAAPPWARPGDLAARLYLTANCGYWLSMLEIDAAGATCAAHYLETRLGPDGGLPSFPHAHWLAAGLWYRMGERAAADAALAHLATLLGSLPASNLAWLVVTLQKAGLSLDHPLLRQARERLAEEQQPDGRWISEDGPAHDVHATLEALRAIQGRRQ